MAEFLTWFIFVTACQGAAVSTFMLYRVEIIGAIRAKRIDWIFEQENWQQEVYKFEIGESFNEMVNNHLFQFKYEDFYHEPEPK